VLAGERVDVVGAGHLGPGRLGLAGGGQRPAHHQLVLRVDQGARTRGHAVAGVDQRLQVLRGHVLVVEGDDGGALGEPAEVGELAVVTQPDVGGDERGRLVRARGKDPQRLPQRDGCLVRHAGELPAADHRHDGQTGARVDGWGHGDC
jgi:hypothetical protein